MTLNSASHRMKLVPLLALLFGNAVAHSLFMIGFPLMGRQLGLSVVQTGALLSVSAFAMMLVTPFWGSYIDRTNRTRPLLCGIVVTALFLIATGALFVYQTHSPFSSLMTIYLMLFALRILQSLGVAGLMPAAQAYIADQTTSEQRFSGMGLMGAAFGIGSILGGYLVMNAGIALFPQTLIGLGAAMLLSLLGYRWLKRTEHAAKSPSHSQPRQRMKLKTVLPYVAITFCMMLIYALLQQTTGLRLQDQLGLTMAEAMKGNGALMTAAMICMAAGQLVLSFVRINRPRRLLLLGLLFGMICLNGLVVADTYQEMLFAMMGTGLAMSLIMPANLTLLSHSAGHYHQAYCASVNTLGKGLGWAAGPLLGGMLYQFTPVMPAWISLALMVVAAILTLYLKRAQPHTVEAAS